MMTNRRNKMMHSSSWPDRAAQTVKMRIDPLSRAFTIIPTSRETVYRLEQTAPRSDYLEEVILLDRCAPKGIASVMIKRKLVDGRPSINKKPTNSIENSDVNNETKKRKSTNRYFMPRSLSSIETTAVHQNGIIVLEENIFRDQSRCKSDFFARNDEAKKTEDSTRASLPKTTDTMAEVAKLFPKNSHGPEEPVNAVAQLTNKSPSFETNAFDVIVNVANERLHAASVAQGDNSQTRETDGVRKECQIAVSPAFSPRHSMSSPPHIKVDDYDDYATSVSFSSKGDHHVCTKCTSEGLLRSEIDPFRSPSRAKRNATAAKAHSFRRDDSIKREKEEAYDKRQNKDIWYAGCLLGEANKLDGQGKNDGLCPARPAIDFRKEATLGRHYYPEGGWGYVIVTCSVLVHFIGVGLQLAAPGCWYITAEVKFRHPPLHSAGKRANILNSYY
ncbi:hypothetical protein EAG_00955 [Camponotus floridanus]|uniref:Uncharacterized protein n=1 Tax=Camponotus floridanus TaxID=104421 RepID=E2A314_CAMFO|nr:hypothetical protein EAG_00955 [Camponotus floridanus]